MSVCSREAIDGAPGCGPSLRLPGRRRRVRDVRPARRHPSNSTQRRVPIADGAIGAGQASVAQEAVQELAGGHRLAAVAVADIVGYSLHLARDEAGTLARLATIRREVVGPAVDGCRGRVVKTLGDGVLTEFPSAADAVACAAAIQLRLAEDNRHLPEDERMECRIGVHFGEIVDISGDIYGTDVNVAARLQAMGAPGEICVSSTVLAAIGDRVSGEVTDLGPQALKNIDQPVHVFQIRPSEVAPEIEDGMGPAVAKPRSRRPSLAVLPFEVVGGTPDDAYLGEGIAEDLMSALARCRWFFVVSRNSSFAVGAVREDVRRTAARLGVRYLVDGMIWRGGDRLRIRARLVDGTDGSQIWSARYDREASEIFAVQDEIVETIAVTVEPELEITEFQRSRRKRPERLDAQDCFYRAHWHFNQVKKADNEIAKTWYRRAIDQEPSYARAHAGLAYAYYADAVFGYVDDPRAALAEGFELASQAVSLDPLDAFAHHTLGSIYRLLGRLDASIAELQKAIEVNPNHGQAHYGLGFSFALAGEPERALPLLYRAQRLSPNDPIMWAFWSVISLAHQLLGAEAEAEFAARRGVESPRAEFWGWLQLASVLGHRGKRAEAAEALAEGFRLKPSFTIAMMDRTFVFREPAHRKIYIEGLIAAGLPEPVEV
jgi:adenylate cyclase